MMGAVLQEHYLSANFAKMKEMPIAVIRPDHPPSESGQSQRRGDSMLGVSWLDGLKERLHGRVHVAHGCLRKTPPQFLRHHIIILAKLQRGHADLLSAADAELTCVLAHGSSGWHRHGRRKALPSCKTHLLPEGTTSLFSIYSISLSPPFRNCIIKKLRINHLNFTTFCPKKLRMILRNWG
jgi:hypothetical protein